MRRHVGRAPVDHEAVRYFVYRLLDANGVPVYIGRSCDVRRRIRAHYADATDHRNNGVAERAAWVWDCRSVSMVGPFTWKEACRIERAEIEKHQPRGNRMHTKAHGYLPLSAGGGRRMTPERNPARADSPWLA